MPAANIVRENYKKERKRYTNQQRHLCLKEIEGMMDADITYIRDQSNKLRLIKDVAATRTKLGYNYSSKHIVLLQFAEEALQVLKDVVFDSWGGTKEIWQAHGQRQDQRCL